MHLQICEDLIRKYGLGLKTPTAAEFMKLSRSGAVLNPMKAFFKTVGFAEQDAERATQYYRENFAGQYPPIIFPFVEDLLRSLRKSGLSLGIVTANVRVNVEPALGSLWSLFDTRLVYTYDHATEWTKAKALNAGVQQLAVTPNDVVFVGDQLADRDAAQQAGVRFVGVTYGWGISRDDRGFDTVHDPRELAVYLLNGEEQS